MKENNKFDGLKDIDEFLAEKNFPVEISELDNLVSIVCSNTDLNQLEAEQIVTLFFQEIRKLMLNGQIVYLNRLGKFFIASPRVSNLNRKIFAKFQPGPILRRLMNNVRKQII